MRTPLLIVPLSVIACVAAVDLLRATEFGRDPDAFYLDALPADKQVEVTALQTAGIFGDRSLSFHTQNVSDGTKLTVLAYHPQAYYVQNSSARIKGWIHPNDVSKLSDETVALIKETAQEARRIAEAIEKNTVVIGMTFNDVLASIGKPNGRSSRQDVQGRTDRWSYIVYERRTEYRSGLDELGREITVPVTVKIPVGALDVDFIDGKVVALQEEKTDDGRSRDVEINPPRSTVKK